MVRNYVVGETVSYHGVCQMGSEWLATVVQVLFSDTYMIRFNDATMKLVHSRDLEPWEGPYHEDDNEVDYCD